MADIYQDYFRANTISMDTFGMFCGKMLGEVTYRTVYEYALDTSLVVKFEHGAASFSNATEWELWQDVKEIKKARKWLAPCVRISGCGILLLQKRTSPLPEDYDLQKHYPKGIPDWLSDVKRSNWGLLDGDLVCHDYGNNLCIGKAVEKQKRTKMDFWC